MNVEMTTKIVFALTCARGLASVEYLESQAIDIDRTVSSPYEETSPQPSRRTPTLPRPSSSAGL